MYADGACGDIVKLENQRGDPPESGEEGEKVTKPKNPHAELEKYVQTDCAFAF